jgi:hypothetical protein
VSARLWQVLCGVAPQVPLPRAGTQCRGQPLLLPGIPAGVASASSRMESNSSAIIASKAAYSSASVSSSSAPVVPVLQLRLDLALAVREYPCHRVPHLTACGPIDESGSNAFYS